MDLVRGIFKQKIAASLLFFEVFPEYIPNPLSTKVENNSTSAVSSSNPGKGRRRWGRVLVWAPNVKGRREGLD